MQLRPKSLVKKNSWSKLKVYSLKDNLIVTSNNNITIKIFDVKLLDAEGPNSVFAIAAYRCQNGNSPSRN